MKAHVHELIAAATKALAGTPHTEEELSVALFQLALDITSPARSGEPPRGLRRMPMANEVLPRHQRASWARAKTIYDVEGDVEGAEP